MFQGAKIRYLVLVTKIDVSSANVSERDSFLAYAIPSFSLVLLIFISNNSTARIKSYGETEKPHLLGGLLVPKGLFV